MKAVNVMAEGIPLRHHITQQIRSMLELTGEHSGAIRDALAQEIENFIDPEEGAA
ncbi:MAG TPA: hypothetical protein VMG98_16475 [Verrucomicrobiae bacterium]|nr:hypothetical protein [Verrucomicrobiae bacterium]